MFRVHICGSYFNLEKGIRFQSIKIPCCHRVRRRLLTWKTVESQPYGYTDCGGPHDLDPRRCIPRSRLFRVPIRSEIKLFNTADTNCYLEAASASYNHTAGFLQNALIVTAGKGKQNRFTGGFRYLNSFLHYFTRQIHFRCNLFQF